jgi:hypothetical protein
MTEKKPSPDLKKNTKKDAPLKDSKAPSDEIGGYADQKLPEPTRYGDWEVKGRCSDF